MKRFRSVAFYLPQFHPIPENDEWWGTGFTDWVNVVRARPRFRGHYQPHLPGALGFYDLRLPETREAQAWLAREHGVEAFCYYHYWFSGRRLLDRPFREVLESGRPEHEFCLCWANEDWTRRWDGREGDILVSQQYSDDDHRDHARSLMPAFADPRYLRIEGRPLFLVYRASLIPDVRKATDVWRDEVSRAGLGEPFLCRVESFASEHDDARELGFDAAVEFQPDWRNLASPIPARLVRRLGVGGPLLRDRVVSYRDVVEKALSQPEVPWLRFPCVTPSWDNSARRPRDAVILAGSDPELYGAWVEAAAHRALGLPVAETLLFVNAWNEWAEGCHLEPDQQWGDAYVRAHRAAIDRVIRASCE